MYTIIMKINNILRLNPCYVVAKWKVLSLNHAQSYNNNKMYLLLVRRIRTDPLIYEVHPTTYLFKYAIFPI